MNRVKQRTFKPSCCFGAFALSRKRIRCFIAGSVYALVFSLAGFGSVHAQSAHHGIVIDRETKEPIEGAVVLVVWSEQCPGIIRPMVSVYDAQQTVTDKDGNFIIPGITRARLRPLAKIREPRFTIFRPGYQAIGDRILNPPVAKSTIEKYGLAEELYEKDGAIAAELKRLTTREERLKNLDKISIASDVPAEKYPDLIRLGNIERESLGLKPIHIQTGQKRSSADTFKPTVIARNQAGNVIREGVGFGEILIGNAEADLLAKWGHTEATRGPAGSTYHYLLDSGEGIIVHVKNAEVAAIVFWPTCNLSSLPSEAKTAKGVGLWDSFEKVKVTYGNPDFEKGGLVFYTTQGIGFLQDGTRVIWIITYDPAKFPEQFR